MEVDRHSGGDLREPLHPLAGWGSPQQIATVPTGSTYPVVDYDSTGIPHVVWADTAIRATRYVNGAWVTSDSLGTGGNFRILADGTGNVTLVWLDYNQTIVASRWNGSSWSSSSVLSDSSAYASFPEVAIDGAGNLLVAYGQTVGTDYTYRDAWVTRYTLGTGWESPELIETDSLRLAESVGVGMDAAGNAVVGWSGCVGFSSCTVFATRYVAGVGWRGQKVLMATGWAEPMMFAFDGEGTPVAVWEDQNTVAGYTAEFQ